MNTIGIVAEYNPFHKGHAYQIAEAKRKSGADYCIIVMSGNFLQRGEVACVDKFTRAHCALLNGADLVLELPTPFATATAPVFAKNAVALLQATGVVSHISFGCEDDTLTNLVFLANFFSDEPEKYKELLKENLKTGLSYPAARKKALTIYLHNNGFLLQENNISANKLADLLDTPNNILALSYLRANKDLSANLIPVPIKRIGAGYHETKLGFELPSATAIRQTLTDKNTNDVDAILRDALPDNTFAIIKKVLSDYGLLYNDDFSDQLHYKLLSLSDYSYNLFFEITEAISNRLKRSLPEFSTFTEFTKLLMRKNETYSTISRGLMHILLDIKENEFEKPQYLRVLGLKKDAAPLLHEIKEKSQLPLITKPAAAFDLLSKDGIKLLKKDFFAENLYHSALRHRTETAYHPYKKAPIVL